ncbi:MAG: helix-hairpin-helix domain-containing protein [Prevotella sp.]|nr:helix-hairpin-helix domain-containing protein [Prevotella sp.]
MILKEFFYLRKSDRKVILTLLCVIVVALVIIFLTGGESGDTNALTPADTLRGDTFPKRTYHSRYHRVDTVYLQPRYVTYPARRGNRSYRPSETVTVGRDSVRTTYQPRHKISEGEHVVLNTADTTALMTVPGIGAYYAKRILQYGQRLGGYVSVEQLDEIDDLPAGVKRYFVVEQPSPRKLNVNQLSLNELRRHPYINFYQAKAITDYRRLHGPIKSLHDLRLSKDFPQEVIDRLSPYVDY